MNDRFKFRVIRGENPFTPTGTVLHFALGDEAGFGQGDIIEQCTGLKDKNGNLIYENDRVGFYVYGQDEEWHAQQGTVIWYNSCWGIETSSRFIQFENELTMKNPRDIEIIGNIHKQAEQKD